MADYVIIPATDTALSKSVIRSDGILLGGYYWLAHPNTTVYTVNYTGNTLHTGLLISFNSGVVVGSETGVYDPYYTNLSDSIDEAYYHIGDLAIHDNLYITGNTNFSTVQSAISAIKASMAYPITYRDTNCTHIGPTEAAVGDTVTVNYTFPDGYGIVNSSDIYVTNNGVLIPSTYANGTLTFTMSDPS